MNDLIRKKKIIAVYGSNGSGKTTIAIKVAKELAKRKNNVVILFADRIVSSLPLVSKNEYFKSMGKLLNINIKDNELISDADIKSCLVRCNKETKFLGAMGYLPSETSELNYVEFDVNVTNTFIDRLYAFSEIDYLVVDCESNLFDSAISKTAFVKADERLFVCNADIKSVDYKQSVIDKLKVEVYQWKEKIIINKLTQRNAVSEFKMRLGNCNFEIEYNESLFNQYLEGRLLDEIDNLIYKQNSRLAMTLKTLAANIDIKEKKSIYINEDLIITDKNDDEDGGNIENGTESYS